MCACNNTPLPCTTCSQTTTCVGCSHTLNTDCVVFNKEKLDFELSSVTDNSSRTLTSVLQAIDSPAPFVDVEFHTIGLGGFTLDPASNNKLIQLYDAEGTIGLTATVILPVNSLEYANKVYTFINKTPAANGTWHFNVPLIVDYDPLTTQTAYNTIVTSGTKILKIAFMKTSDVSWGWVIIQN